jgi:hypothetical protein
MQEPLMENSRFDLEAAAEAAAISYFSWDNHYSLCAVMDLKIASYHRQDKLAFNDFQVYCICCNLKKSCRVVGVIESRWQ